MYANVQPFIKNESVKQFTYEYNKVKDVLFTILDSPIKYTQHIGGTCHFNYQTEPILDILVGVNNLRFDTNVRKAIAFNISGPVCLGVSAIYCMARDITFQQLKITGKT